MGTVRSRRWRGNVLFPLSESLSCWQTSSWPFPSQTMSLLYFICSSPVPPGRVCVSVCVVFNACVCTSSRVYEHNMWPAGCLTICCPHVKCQSGDGIKFIILFINILICVQFVCVCVLRWIWSGEIDPHQLFVLDGSVLQGLPWALPAHQEDCAGELNQLQGRWQIYTFGITSVVHVSQ